MIEESGWAAVSMVESKVKTLPMVAGVDDSVSLPDGEPELFTNVGPRPVGRVE